MGDDALEIPDEQSADDGTEVELESKDGDVTLEGDKQSEDPPEFEVVRQGIDGSQPTTKRQSGFQKRIGKLNARNVVSEEKASEASAALILEQEKNKLLSLALDQQNEAKVLKAPDPDDFDEGVSDRKYIDANREYNQSFIASEVEKHTANISAQQNSQPAIDTELRTKQEQHYEAAAKLGARDYADIEDKTIEILGKETVNHLIKNSDNSPAVLYYLGKNPHEAEEIAELIKTNPVRATLQLGRLEAELKIRPKGKDESAPNPDDELEGGSPSSTAVFERRLDKLREKAASGNHPEAMGQILKLKREERDKGVST